MYSDKFSLPYPRRFVFALFSVSIIFVSEVSDSGSDSKQKMKMKMIKVVSVPFSPLMQTTKHLHVYPLSQAKLSLDGKDELG